MHYSVADLNIAALAPDAYDVVVAHSILHHVESLSSVISRRCLDGDTGSFQR